VGDPATAEDLRQILAVLAEYGATLDEQRWSDHRELWTEAAELFVFGRTHRGRDAIEKFMRRAVLGKHITAVPRVEIEGDHARSAADFVFYRAPDLAPFSAGVYHDEWERSDGRWRLARREIEIQLSAAT
jgi:SnoaL-like domain